MCALDFDGGGIKLVDADTFGKKYAKDYLK